MERTESWDERWTSAICQTYSLDKDLVRRLGEEFLALTSESLEEYVSRQHLHYQARGLANEEIYRRIQQEVAGGRFRVETPSLRRIRRIIYG